MTQSLSFFNYLPNYESLAANFINPNSKIARLANSGKPQEEFLYANIKEFMDSDKYKTMQIAQRYYTNKGDIKDRKRWFYGREGAKFEIKSLANTKLTHPFIFKLVTQKINYLLTNDFEIITGDDNYKEVLKTDYFNKKFSRTLKRTVADSVVNGIGWLQAFYDDQGVLGFNRIPSHEVIPFWADSDHTVLDAIVRFYTIIEYQVAGGKKEIVKVEFYDKTGVWYYQQGDNGLIPDPDRAVYNEDGSQRPHANFYVNSKNAETGQDQSLELLWDKIPFIAFKYNADEMSVIDLVKSLVDDYDETRSDFSNLIKDVPNSIKIIKGYSGENKEEFNHNLAIFRTVFVGPDGGVDSLDTPIDPAASEAHADRLRKDIHHFASGVDTQETDMGNASGVAIKFRYGDLDNDMNTLEAQLQQSFEELAFFIDIDLQGKGKGDYTATEFEIEFVTFGIINETELISNCKSSVGVVSDETILEHHPWVKDAVAEKKKVDAQHQEDIDEQKDLMNTKNSGFGQPNQKGASSGKPKK